MRENRFVRAERYLFGLALGLAIVISGCEGGNDKDSSLVKPEVPPEVKAKDSMDAYLKSMSKGANKASVKK